MEVGREVSAIIDEGRGEHVAGVIRLRRAALIAAFAWPAFGIADWFIVTFVHQGNLLHYLSLRAIGLGLLVLGSLRIRSRKMPGPTELRMLEVGLCMSLCALIAGQALAYDGIESPLAMGAMLIILGRGALVAQSWRQGLVPVLLISSTYGAAMLVFALFRPEIAAQLAQPTSMARFALFQTFLFAAGALTLASGHLVWNLKRQIYEQRTLGRYKLKRRIGEGGMGEVWAAHHGALRRDVAVKILRPDNTEDPQVVARFEREVRATSELNHPHTIRVFDYGSTEDGLWYYVMELLEGTDLARLVAQSGPLHPARAVKILWQASKAMAEAHQRGLTHRDLKPENLFVTQVEGEGDFVKVLDFGLVKLSESEPATNLTSAGWALGTPMYVSPEVAEGGQATARSDVYGLGAVLYYALCGTPPFKHTDLRQLLIAHVSEPPLLPSARLGRPIPDPIEAVVMRCLAKRAEDRYTDAGDLARALEEAAATSEQVPVRPLTAERASSPPLAFGSEVWETAVKTPAVGTSARTDTEEAENEDTIIGYRLPPF